MNQRPTPNNEGDRLLWQRVVADDTQAFEQVVERYQGIVSAVAYNLLGDFARSQDVAQETFWQAWRSRDQLRDPNRLAPWLCGISRNQACQWLRRNRHAAASTGLPNERLIAASEDPVANVITLEEKALVWDTLERIPEKNREALLLYYREGLAVAEISDVLDISLDAAKQRLRRGRDMIRDRLAEKVEGVLKRSKPGRRFTTRVMVGVAALSASLKAGSSAAAAGVGPAIVKGASGGAASMVTKAVAGAGATTGLLGGLLGAAGGLGGAWLGTWIPAQLAPTQSEREHLEHSAKGLFRMALIYTLVILLTPLLLLLPGGWWPFTAVLATATVVFIVVTIRMTLISQREIAKLRRSISLDDDPNHSFLRQRLSSQSASSFRTLGVRYTSPWTLAGWPLLDVQFGDPQLYGGAAGLHARGWIALGDRATGILFAVGGIARGLVACGGVAIGGLAIGGLSVGLLSLGGAALGGLAVGGLGIGYDSVGGLAIGWHSAAGGAAIAHDVAVGGGAAARHFAVGGAASANEANTPAARLAVESESYLWVVQWISDHHLVFIAATVLLSILPAFLLPFCYRRVPVQEADSSADEDDENED